VSLGISTPNSPAPDDQPLVSPATRRIAIGSLPLECGQVLPDVELAYRTWGKPSDEAILICHALTGSADADDWWRGLFGSGRVCDPERRFVVASNTIGSCYGSTGPTSLRPDGSTWGPDLPPITIRDMVHAQARLLERLGVDRLTTVLGGSMGGMQVLEWAALYPQRVRSVVPVAISPAHSAWCIAISEAQRQAIYADSRWRGGRYPQGDGPAAGLAAARMMAIVSYRSWPSFGGRFGRREREPGMFDMESYLRYQGEKLVRRFDANAYVILTRAMDSHDLGRDRGDVSAALGELQQPALVVGISSDVLYPLHEQEELAAALPAAELFVLDSPHGHDAFLIDMEALDRRIEAFLAGLDQRT
jgi:homoserine O-acetyltransferase